MNTGQPANSVDPHSQTMLDTTPVLIWMSDLNQHRVCFNKAWLQFSGRTLEQEIGKAWAAGIHPADLFDFTQSHLLAFKQERAYSIQYRLKRHDGQYRWLLENGLPRFSDQGVFTGFTGSCTDITDLLNAEQIKQDQILSDNKKDNYQFEQIINMLPASVVIIRGEELIVETINQANLDYWDKSKEEVIGRPFLEILPDLADQPFAAQLREVIRTGINIDVKDSPVIFVDEHGHKRETYVDYSYQAITDENGIRNGVLVMSFEVTDRIQSQLLSEKLNHELAASEARFKYFIMEAPVAIGVLQGRELIVESPNTRILQVWGKTESIIGLPLKEALPELRGQPFLSILDHVYLSGIPFYANEIRSLLEHDGLLKEIFFNVVYQPVKNAQGKTTDILVVAVDVTEQVNARKNVERAKESLRLAIEAAELGTYHINLDKGQLVSSAKLKEFFGFLPEEEMSYQDAAMQIDPNYRHTANDLVTLAITTGQKFDLEFPVTGKHDGFVRWVRAVGTIQQNSQGSERYFTGVLNEITQKKLDEQRKNDFIAMVSHELKTPLTSLSALLQILSNKLHQHADTFVPNAVEKSLLQVKKMNSLISGFLNVSQLESGKIKLELARFDLCVLVSEVIEDLKLTKPDFSITFQHHPNIWVNADRNKISSVISNFLSNAMKYSALRTTIEVDCTALDDHAKLSVTDHGMGINPQSVSKIFERFYRVESTQTKNITGFGIGLYLSSEIIGHHEGEIGVESQPGEGSTFWFSLPLSPDPEG